MIDGENFDSLEGFYDEVGRVLAAGEPWSRNLDAINDILSWPSLESGIPCTLIWKNSANICWLAFRSNCLANRPTHANEPDLTLWSIVRATDKTGSSFRKSAFTADFLPAALRLPVFVSRSASTGLRPLFADPSHILTGSANPST
ncbi:MAG TPA: barstar family protein [Pirellulales bacterium]|nr:barstar family protein [Pirellulales bacterium]